jgi:hypothetical protein
LDWIGLWGGSRVACRAIFSPFYIQTSSSRIRGTCACRYVHGRVLCFRFLRRWICFRFLEGSKDLMAFCRATAGTLTNLKHSIGTSSPCLLVVESSADTFTLYIVCALWVPRYAPAIILITPRVVYFQLAFRQKDAHLPVV